MAPRLNVWLTPERCVGCALCVKACPKGLLYIDGKAINKLGHQPVAIRNPERCVACALCALVCKHGVIEVYED